MSFAFTVDKDEYDYDTDTRKILSIDKLFDVSVVDTPFYDSTSVYARSDNDDFMIRRAELRKQHEDKLALEKAKEELLTKLG